MRVAPGYAVHVNCKRRLIPSPNLRLDTRLPDDQKISSLLPHFFSVFLQLMADDPERFEDDDEGDAQGASGGAANGTQQ
jgi:hypothetical protein